MLMAAILAQISDIAVTVREHFLQEVRVIIVDTLLSELLVVNCGRVHSVPMVSYPPC